MPDSPSPTTDRERIVQTLIRVARRRRFVRVTRELLHGFTLSLILPISLSVLYRFVPMRGAVVAVVVGLWLLGLAAYAYSVLSHKETLLGTAGAVDRKADLHDELTTAYWFHQEGRSDDWVAVQQHRAAGTARELDVERLYAWSMPRRARTAAGLMALLLTLNLLPLSWTRGWLEARPPVAAFTDADQMLLSEIERMLDNAALAQGTELSPEMREALAQLQRGQLTEEQARTELEKLQSLLDGQLDPAELDELLTSMAETLASANDELAQALSESDLARAAEQLRELAETMTDAEREQLQAALEQMAEQAEGSMEDLAEQLADAAQQLAEGDETEARQAMEELAQQLEQLAQEQQGEEMRQAAAQGLEQLQQALSDDPEQLQAAEETASGDQSAAGMPQPGPMNQDAMSMEAGEAGSQSAEQGQGDLSAPGAGDEIEYGTPTGLEVELQPELMELSEPPQEEPGEQLLDQPSQVEESKIAYEQVEPDLTYGEADALDPDTIPLSYRDLVKRYFQAVGPRGQHDH
jgi:hypothetical protein